MLKKVISISFLILIFILGFQLFINYLKTEHEINYMIENNYGLFYINESYEKINEKDYYFFDINFNDVNYLFQSDNYFNKQKEVIKDIEVFNSDNISCIALVYIDDEKSSSPLCSQDGVLSSYYKFKDIDGFGDFLKSIPNFWSNISLKNKKNEISDVYINSGYIYDDEVFLIYNYKNIIKFDKDFEELLPFSVYDNYKNTIGILVDKYYLIPKMNSNPEYNVYLIFYV